MTLSINSSNQKKSGKWLTSLRQLYLDLNAETEINLL